MIMAVWRQEDGLLPQGNCRVRVKRRFRPSLPLCHPCHRDRDEIRHVRSMCTQPDRCHSLRHLLTLSRAAPTMLPSSRWDTRTLSAGRLSASGFVLARSQANFAATHGRAGDITPSDHSAKKFRSVASPCNTAVHPLNASRSARACRAPRESAPAADRPARCRTIRATLPPSLTSETPPHLGRYGVGRMM